MPPRQVFSRHTASLFLETHKETADEEPIPKLCAHRFRHRFLPGKEEKHRISDGFQVFLRGPAGLRQSGSGGKTSRFVSRSIQGLQGYSRVKAPCPAGNPRTENAVRMLQGTKAHPELVRTGQRPGLCGRRPGPDSGPQLHRIANAVEKELVLLFNRRTIDPPVRKAHMRFL